MLVKNLEVGTLVNVANDPFFNAKETDGGPDQREVEAIKPTTGEFRYILYTGARVVTYPNDYEVQVIDAES